MNFGHFEYAFFFFVDNFDQLVLRVEWIDSYYFLCFEKFRFSIFKTGNQISVAMTMTIWLSDNLDVANTKMVWLRLHDKANVMPKDVLQDVNPTPTQCSIVMGIIGNVNVVEICSARLDPFDSWQYWCSSEISTAGRPACQFVFPTLRVRRFLSALGDGRQHQPIIVSNTLHGGGWISLWRSWQIFGTY